MTNTPNILLAADAVAEVRARDHVIRYQRTGSGTPALVLVGANARSTSPGWSELLAALAARFRLLVPELAGAPGDTASLTGFLEGLGAVSVDVIAADTHWLPAVQLALAGDDLVARIVVIVDEADQPTAMTTGLVTGGRSAPIPMLLASDRLPSSVLIDVVTRFLDEPRRIARDEQP